MAIKVRAKTLGLYKGVRQREGREFTVQHESEIARWMERLDGKPHPKLGKQPAKSAAPAPAPARTMAELNQQEDEAVRKAAEGKSAKPEGPTI